MPNSKHRNGAVPAHTIDKLRSRGPVRPRCGKWRMNHSCLLALARRNLVAIQGAVINEDEPR